MKRLSYLIRTVRLLIMVHFDRIAHRYDIVRKPPIGDLLKVAKPRKADRVLDIGGGTGVVAARIKPLVRDVCVLDSSPKMLEVARTRNVKTILGNTHKIPFAAKTFDLIICTGAFHHIKNQEQALLEIKRVLKPTGRIVFEEYKPSFRGKLFVIIGWLMRFNIKFHSPSQLAKLLNRYGFKTTIRDHNSTYFVKATLQ